MIGADFSLVFGLLLALPDALAAMMLAWSNVSALDVRHVLGLACGLLRR